MSGPPPAALSSPPMTLDLDWSGGLVFQAQVGDNAITIDSDGKTGLSPVQALAAALAGCMSIDVVHILTKGREDLRGLKGRLVGWRAADDPHRFVRIDLKFTLRGEIHPDRVERALALSREKYCSVWHSMRQDIDFTIAFEFEKP